MNKQLVRKNIERKRSKVLLKIYNPNLITRKWTHEKGGTNCRNNQPVSFEKGQCRKDHFKKLRNCSRLKRVKRPDN